MHCRWPGTRVTSVPSAAWKIVQVFNNNVVLAESDGDRAVLLGRGIGFGRAAGAAISGDSVQEVFHPVGAEAPEQLARLIIELRPEILALARDLAETASFMCDVEIPDSTVVAMADHIRFAIDRAVEGVILPNPLWWEVSQFYPREFSFGLRALHQIKQVSGVGLPEEEAVSLALHVVNAQFAQQGASPSNMARTAQVTNLLTRTFDVIDAATGGTELDRNSMAAARFVTHLRFLLRRMLDRGPSPHEPEPGMLKLGAKVSDEYPVAFTISGKVIMMLQLELDTQCSEDEVVYLALHIARLMQRPR